MVLRRSPQSITFETNAKAPSIVQSPYGLGRVTLIGFDIDQEPFAGWANRKDFWTALLDFRQPVSDRQGGGLPFNFQNNDLASALTYRLEQFGDVQVIPFGYVALFIFIYILIVGPVDYLFLKKVVKRLEWTWITFPTVVVVVSVGAYFLAYYLKGDELKINKVDVVDIDLHPQTRQVYGSSWFTVFSPRLQHYDIGVEASGF